MDGGVLEVIAGAAVGALLGIILTELANAVKKGKHKAAMFTTTMNELEAILGHAQRVEVDTQQPFNDDKNVCELRKLMLKGNKLVLKCSKFHSWEYIRKIRYQKKLLQLNKDLVWFLILYIENQNHKFQKRNHSILLALYNLQNKMMVPIINQTLA